MKIAVTGQIGLETAERLLRENRINCEERFPAFFIRQFEALCKNKAAEGSGKQAMPGRRQTAPDNTEPGNAPKSLTGHNTRWEILEGGLFGTIWKACAELGCGCEVFLKDIPVKQEVVEILELMGENPYEAESEDAWLLIGDFEEEAGESVLPEITVIGRTTSSKGRVIINGESRRFLEPPARQQTAIEARKKDYERGGTSRKYTQQ